MEMKPLEIYKHLPKKNCKECGFPTCLAFAMQLAKQNVELSRCPYISQGAEEILGTASRPPIRGITVGSGEKSVEIGNEKVLFRHEEKFYNQSLLAVEIVDTMGEKEIEEKLKRITSIRFERVGEMLELDAICVKERSGDLEKFKRVLTLCKASDFPLIIISHNVKFLKTAGESLSSENPVVGFAEKETLEKICKIAKKYGASIIVRDETLEGVAKLAERAKSQGIEEIILSCGEKSPSERLKDLTAMRRAAIKKGMDALGYPVMTVLTDNDPLQNTLNASIYLAKYSSLIVFPDIPPEDALALLTLRQNIYTDPQKPLQMEPDLYKIGSPDKTSPVLLTTNFSLTYFTVAGDAESSGIPCYLLVCDTEGLSVLTAFAADKLTPKKISKFIEKTEIGKKVDHREIIIPGLVSKMSGALEEKSGWKVVVGPKDSKDLKGFLERYRRG